MFETVTQYLNDYGYPFLFIVVCLESTGLPLPGESLVVAAGMLSGEGSLNILAVLIATWSGAIFGDNVGYFVGRRYGRKIVLKWGEKFGLGEKRFAMVEQRFQNYGMSVVLIARFVIILRQLNGFVAGTMKMSWPIFFLYNAISAALWAGAYGFGAYLFGAAFQNVFEGRASWPIVLIAIAICAVGCFGTYRFLFADDTEDDKPESSDETAQPNEEKGRSTVSEP